MTTDKFYKIIMMTVDEDNVIGLMKKNVNDAYFFIYKKMYVPLCNFATYYVKNSEAADDIVQEVFVSLLNIKREFNDYQEFKFYLYKSVKNKSINYIRHELIKEYYSDGAFTVYEEENNTFYDRMLEEDVYSNLVFAIEELPPKCKSVINLTMEGYKTNEIAERLSISHETVKEHKSTAKNKLRATFKRIDKIYIIILWIISSLQ